MQFFESIIAIFLASGKPKLLSLIGPVHRDIAAEFLKIKSRGWRTFHL
jgi:hypothetical protein